MYLIGHLRFQIGSGVEAPAVDYDQGRQAFDQPDHAHAGETWRKVAEQLHSRWPKLADLMNASEPHHPGA